MGKKVQLKGYLVISPCSPRFGGESFFIGGVSASSAIEAAGEEGGFVVPMTGEYDSDQLIEMYQEKVDKWRDRLATETTGDPKWRAYGKWPEKQAKYVAETMECLQVAEKELEEAKKEFAS